MPLVLRLLLLVLLVECGFVRNTGRSVSEAVGESVPLAAPWCLWPPPSHVPGTAAEGSPGDRAKRREGHATRGGLIMLPFEHHSRWPRSTLKVSATRR